MQKAIDQRGGKRNVGEKLPVDEGLSLVMTAARCSQRWKEAAFRCLAAIRPSQP